MMIETSLRTILKLDNFFWKVLSFFKEHELKNYSEIQNLNLLKRCVFLRIFEILLKPID